MIEFSFSAKARSNEKAFGMSTEREAAFLKIFESNPCVTFLAPMVRYSRLPFRLLCRKWGTDVNFSPMFVASCFRVSQRARDADFTTTETDRPLIVQFAASDPVIFSEAAELVATSCDAVDLNCGCPQKWANKDGLGGEMLNHPELIKDMVTAVRSRTGLPCTVKIRVQEDERRTVDLVQSLEHAGASLLTVHGRRPRQPASTPVDLEAIKRVKESISIPVIANGNVFSPADVVRTQELTGANGVMSARGLLQNPALFGGYDRLPIECIHDFIRMSLEYGLSYYLMRTHMMFMLYPLLAKPERRELAECASLCSLMQFLRSIGLGGHPDLYPSCPSATATATMAMASVSAPLDMTCSSAADVVATYPGTDPQAPMDLALGDEQ
eukprot:gnl/Trimastix_PCT/95.p1 GENE.gnl/Trimastix_PCT/95~~gnl/Trimastix_PCT/95.p1  ORF type:complete len:383 (+),score=54.55 gnl/Trimastix_PCT/95:302-1450(+)